MLESALQWKYRDWVFGLLPSRVYDHQLRLEHKGLSYVHSRRNRDEEGPSGQLLPFRYLPADQFGCWATVKPIKQE
jgi:hypothetical protein